RRPLANRTLLVPERAAERRFPKPVACQYILLGKLRRLRSPAGRARTGLLRASHLRQRPLPLQNSAAAPRAAVVDQASQDAPRTMSIALRQTSAALSDGDRPDGKAASRQLFLYRPSRLECRPPALIRTELPRSQCFRTVIRPRLTLPRRCRTG